MIKQRSARRNEGMSRGFKSIILFRRGDRAFFFYGFAKGDRDNLRPGELEVCRSFADEVFGYDEADLDKAVDLNKLKELKDHGKDVPKCGPRGNPRSRVLLLLRQAGKLSDERMVKNAVAQAVVACTAAGARQRESRSKACLDPRFLGKRSDSTTRC